MLINWFTVLAQIINFFVLVYLMKRYLYKPVLKAIDERESKITARLKDAEGKKTEAEKEKAEYEGKNREFAKEKEKMMSGAINETKAEKSRLIEEARKEYTALKSKLELALSEEQDSINEELANLTRKEVYSMTAKALKELADSSLEENVIKVFINQLSLLKEEDAKKLAESVKAGVTIKTAFTITTAQEEAIKMAVNKINGIAGSFHFVVDKELVGGIELTSGGFKLAWNIEHYMGSLQKNVEDLIKRKSGNLKETLPNAE